jgi:hypothetical protein
MKFIISYKKEPELFSLIALPEKAVNLIASSSLTPKAIRLL